MKLNRAVSRNQVVFVAASIALATLAGCKKSQNTETGAQNAGAGDTINVGEVGSMTGAQATFGTSTHNGIELAVNQLNAAGGIKGKKVKLFSLDDQSKPDEAATAVTRLITQNGVKAIIGEVASSVSLAMAPIAQQNKVPMISPSSTNPKVTEVGDYIFRVCFIDPFQGTVMAKFASENLKAKKVAILRDVKSDYSVGLSDFFVETFKKTGGTIVADQSYSGGDIDFKSQLTAIKSKAPDAIFVPGYYNDVGPIARQARELGIKVPLLGGDGWDSPELWKLGGVALNNTYFSNHYSNDDKSPAVQDFVTKYKTTYGVAPDGLAAMGYDAAKVLFDAMGRAKTMSNQDLRDAIAQTKEYPAVTGKISINEKRDAVKSAVVLKVQDDSYKYQITVAP